MRSPGSATKEKDQRKSDRREGIRDTGRGRNTGLVIGEDEVARFNDLSLSKRIRVWALFKKTHVFRETNGSFVVSEFINKNRKNPVMR